MSNKPSLVIVAIGVAGYLVLAWLFPRFSDGAQWRIRLGEEESVARARSVAAGHGMDVSGWTAEAGVRVNGKLNDELASQVGADLSPALQIHVAFRNPNEDDHHIGVRMDPTGRPSAVVVRRDPRPGDDVTVDAATPLAETALRRFVPQASSYRSVAQEDLGPGGVRFRWERSAADLRLVHRATAIVAGPQVRDIRYGLELNEKNEDRRSVTGILDNISDIGVVLAALFGMVLYVMATGRGLVPQRLALTLAGITWPILLMDMLTGLNPGIVATFYENSAAERWTLIIGSAIVGIPPCLAIAGGYPWARRRFAKQLVSFEELLLRGRIGSRSVGAALLTGIAAGGWIAAAPYLIRATGLFGKYHITDAKDDPLFLSGFMPMQLFGGVMPVLLAFAVLVPFAQDKLRGPLGRVLAFVLTLVVLLDDSVGSLVPALLTALLVTILFDQVFRRVDLLALATAAASAAWAISAASRIVQPAASIRADGWTAAGLGFAVAAAAHLVWLWGSMKPYLPWEPRPARAERERIQTEFEVARLAQEQMLPATAPEIPGTTIASFCRPARQVGGDLFDFVPMSDGSVGITVADVSGKGVPAALVMTITKGLLLAASDGRADPLETLADVNAGIHSLGNRSVFVTMLFGVFDPTARTFQFVRAGHTPLLWRKASGEVTALSPRGVGLGMTSARMFSTLCDRTTITTAPGDLLILYSDGVTEAMNEQSEEFGDDLLLTTVRDAITSTMTAEEARAVIVQAVDSFRGTAAAHDNMTLVVVRC